MVLGIGSPNHTKLSNQSQYLTISYFMSSIACNVLIRCGLRSINLLSHIKTHIVLLDRLRSKVRTPIPDTWRVEALNLIQCTYD